jgi:hypothetical protein
MYNVRHVRVMTLIYYNIGVRTYSTRCLWSFCHCFYIFFFVILFERKQRIMYYVCARI